MKILFIQLARLGDIYQTWPILNASLKNSDDEIHLLVRERFKGATVGLDPRVQVHTLKTHELIDPILSEEPEAYELTKVRLERFLKNLEAECFDKVVNLSFSPLSSYLTHYLESEKVIVRGYTRHDDGYLNIPDDSSAYFYAQVGIQKFNRFHLTDIFSSVSEVQLDDADWRVSGPLPFFDRPLPSEYAVIHVGASQSNKVVNPKLWLSLIDRILAETKVSIVLVGEDGETDHWRNELINRGSRVVSLVGKTRVADLLYVIKWAKVCIGGDSVAMHVGSLTKTPCVNFSSRTVRFWETGPLAPSSQIVFAPNLEDISPEMIWEATATTLGLAARTPKIEVVEARVNQPRFSAVENQPDSFEWSLIQALYCEGALPPLDRTEDFQSLCQIRDLTDMALQQIESLRKKPTDTALTILNFIDSSLSQIGELNSVARILNNWLETERIRIGPQSVRSLVEKTQQVYLQLGRFCRLYVGDVRVFQTEGGFDESPNLEP